MSLSYTYTVLRYVHDITTEEFVNVAVALFVPSSRQIVLRRTDSCERLKRVFPGIDEERFLSLMHHVQSGFEDLGEKLVSQPTGNARTALDLAYTVVQRDDSALQWSSLGSGVTDDPIRTTEQVFNRMVRRYQDPVGNARDAEDREYYRNIDECAALGINRIISNGCPEHATYLMTKMLERARARIRLFSGALRDEVDGVPVYGSRDLIRAACGFLCAASRRIEIVVQNDPSDLDAHVFIRAIREAKDIGTIKGSLVVRKAGASAASFDQHFMVADNRAYRLETGGPEVRATANFEDPEFARTLIDAFDGRLFGSGTDLLAI